jgi:hypothetical protein
VAVKTVHLRGDWDNSITNMARGISGAMGKVVKTLAAEGVAAGQEIIATQPPNTPQDWSMWWADMPRAPLVVRESGGRVETGAMYDAFTAKVTRYTVSRNNSMRMTIRVGWPENSPEYFTAQNDGFTNTYKTPGGGTVSVDIAGMNVTGKVADFIERRAQNALRDAVGTALTKSLKAGAVASRKENLNRLGYKTARGITKLDSRTLAEFESQVDRIVASSVGSMRKVKR